MRNIRAAIRLILFTAATLGLYSFWFVIHLFVRDRIRLRQVIFYLWTVSFNRISHMTIEVVGTPPKPPFFLVCNHLSYSDMGALRAVTKGVFVAKAEIDSWFLAGRICRDMGMIFINRTNRRDIPRAGEEIIERLDAGEGVIVFPEGTSSKGEEVLPFNSSFLEFAARSGVPVSYASITYSTPEGEPPASQTACWWDDISFFAHLWRLFKVKGYTAIINFGEAPIVNSDRKVLAEELRDHVAGMFAPAQ